MGQETFRHFEGYRKHNKPERGGRVYLSGDFLKDHEGEILNLINHESKNAQATNPEHKVSKVEKIDGGIIVDTTEHSLAMHIGKSLTRAYKGEHKFTFHDNEKYIEVDWERND